MDSCRTRRRIPGIANTNIPLACRASRDGFANWTRGRQTILKSRYGLADDPSRVTLQSLADQLGLSRERIRQLEIRAIEKLRARASLAALEFEA